MRLIEAHSCSVYGGKTLRRQRQPRGVAEARQPHAVQTPDQEGSRNMPSYIGLIHKDANSDLGVSFPDFPGLITAGTTPDDARAMAEEALVLHVEGMVEDGQSIPGPSRLEEILGNRTGTFILVASADFHDQALGSPSKTHGLICPSADFPNSRQVLPRKIFLFFRSTKHAYCSPSRASSRGTLRIVTSVGCGERWTCWCAETTHTDADGKDVWS